MSTAAERSDAATPGPAHQFWPRREGDQRQKASGRWGHRHTVLHGEKRQQRVMQWFQSVYGGLS